VVQDSLDVLNFQELLKIVAGSARNGLSRMFTASREYGRGVAADILSFYTEAAFYRARSAVFSPAP
jgi:hypothetical protein